MSLLTAMSGRASFKDLISRSSKGRRETEEKEEGKVAFDVPAWSLRAMQARQGERNTHLQVRARVWVWECGWVWAGGGGV